MDKYNKIKSTFELLEGEKITLLKLKEKNILVEIIEDCDCELIYM